MALEHLVEQLDTLTASELADVVQEVIERRLERGDFCVAHSDGSQMEAWGVMDAEVEERATGVWSSLEATLCVKVERVKAPRASCIDTGQTLDALKELAAASSELTEVLGRISRRPE